MPADALSATLFALADPTRRDILARLAEGEATVKELAEPYAMSQAAVSKHLKVLEGAGLVTRRKQAQARPCRLRAVPLRAVAKWVEGYEAFWNRNLDGLGGYLETLQRRRAGTPGTKKKGAKK